MRPGGPFGRDGERAAQSTEDVGRVGYDLQHHCRQAPHSQQVLDLVARGVGVADLPVQHRFRDHYPQVGVLKQSLTRQAARQVGVSAAALGLPSSSSTAGMAVPRWWAP